jgi:hypothetical protein
VSGRGPARLVPLASVVHVLSAGHAACGGGDDAEPAETTSSPTSSATSDDDSTDEPTEEPAEEPAEEPTDDTATISVTRAGDSFTPNGERVELAVGQTLTLTITADEAGELHVHSTPEQEIAYGEGTSEHEITIDRPGVVEVENHDPVVVVLQLEVR